ncbi:MAG: DUF308 domain-containing protein [Prevotella sp.]|nr:DUF308 domain-containing protein [Prevotella sp.]
MKVFQSSIFRAICAIAVGALLIKYREETVTGITIAIGLLFLISGLISCMAYFSAKRRDDSVQVFDAQGNPIAPAVPAFPLVGIGSIVLGALLALAPNMFVNGLMYVLAAILILGALNQFFNLASALKYARIGFFWWVFPTIVLLIGLIAIFKPTLIASAPLFIIGWCMMVYGVVDLVNAIMVYRCRKAYEKAHAPVAQPAEEVAPQTQIEEKPAAAEPEDIESLKGDGID